MATSDTSEKSLEAIIEAYLINEKQPTERQWLRRTSKDFNRDYCLDEGMLREFLESTQKDKVVKAHIYETPQNTRKFLERIKTQITTRGVVDVLRHGLEHNAISFDLYYPTPITTNPSAVIAYTKNRWSVVRQLHFSNKTPLDSIDVVLMLNGLPIITMELKNELSCQDVHNAIRQYQKDRDAKELLFMPKRCAVHFAVDDAEARMCTKLEGEKSWFLPFNKGVDDGAGNPINPNGLKTSYLWEYIFQKPILSEIIENYAQVIKEKDPNTGIDKEKIIWPRYHQLEAVKLLLNDTASKSVGQRYLIQHSAGSGKSNSITWLAYQLVNMKEGDLVSPKFESVIVVTDRVNLDKQIRDNIRAFCNNKSIVQWADDSEALKTALAAGKKIIVSTICKFPFILETIGKELMDKHFAVIIDEAHSSQSGTMSTALNRVLAGFGEKNVDVTDDEDGLNELLEYVVKGRKMAVNANFYAFTATPKNKTLEMFGTPLQTENGETAYRPFHLYSMKQAIEEGFIMDVLEHYTTYDSFYKILKATESNPEFDKDQAAQKLRIWVESRPETVGKKARIMVEHFHESVAHKMGGEARAMIVTPSILRAIDYYYQIKKLLAERKSPYKAIIAFSGTKEYEGKVLDEATLNGFPSSAIEKQFKTGAYRFLIVADKFQTGYDEPLLHTMYVDKSFSDIKAVQTLSRLNRCHPLKQETFVLDFVNKAEDIEQSFQRYYKKTILSHETDANKLSDKLAVCDQSLIYEEDEVTKFNELYFSGAERTTLDPILDKCVERFNAIEEMSDKINVKASMKQFVRLYEFLCGIREMERTDWEKKDCFFRFLLRKMPALPREDWAEGLIELVDFEKYRVVKKEEISIKLQNQNATIDPIPVSDGGATPPTPDMVTLERIVDDFNMVFGDIEWSDKDVVEQQIRQVVEKLQNDDEVRDSLLNNDESMQQQTIHEHFRQELGIVTANSSELQTRYLTQPNIQNQVDYLIWMRLQQQINPDFNERELSQILLDKFAPEFRELNNLRSLEEAVEWLFKILDTPSVRTLDGLKRLKRTLNLVYRTEGRDEDLRDWLAQLINDFEAYLKKIYYLSNNKELTNADGSYVQFLDAAKATNVNRLHYSIAPELNNFKVFYEFLHAQRNEFAHTAPVIEDDDVLPGIHMTTAMYLYATMINISELEAGEDERLGRDSGILMAAENDEVGADEVAQEHHEPTIYPKLPPRVKDTIVKEALYLTIKQVYFDQIIDGSKKIEYREIKPTTIGRYIQHKDGHPVHNPNASEGEYPYLPIPYKYLDLAVGYQTNRDTARVEITGFTFFYEDGVWVMEIHLGDVVELNRKK